jgi:ParB-like chromosome segregation protein Spo0J
MDGNILALTEELIDEIKKINNIDDKINIINKIRYMIHKISPLNNHPVDFVKWVKSDNIEGNKYNPNYVDKKNMQLLKISIKEDGYTMPIVGNEENNKIKIVDGFHRRKAERMDKKISKSTYGRIPVTQIRENKRDIKNRMSSTIRHNRARGVHEIELMSNLVVELVQKGWSDIEIANQLGMNADEVLRLKQISGIAEIFKDLNYSMSWEFKELK